MAVMCTACGLEIPLGHESTSISRGLVRSSKKSGRVYHEEHSADPLHATIECQILYLSQLSLTDSGSLVDSLVEMVREVIKPDLKIEVQDEFDEDRMMEMRDSLIDEYGKTCAVCDEHIDDMAYADEEEVHNQSNIGTQINPRIQPTGWLQPVPLKTS